LRPIRIIDIPPYQRAGVNYDPVEGHFMMKDLVANLRANAHLEGVEITIATARSASSARSRAPSRWRGRWST
jgi:hypothetical protein